MAGIPSIGFAQSSASGVSLSNSINDTFNPTLIIGSSESEVRSNASSDARAEGRQESTAKATNETPSLFGGGGGGGPVGGVPSGYSVSGFSQNASASFNPFEDSGKNNTLILALLGVGVLVFLKMKGIV